MRRGASCGPVRGLLWCGAGPAVVRCGACCGAVRGL